MNTINEEKSVSEQLDAIKESIFDFYKSSIQMVTPKFPWVVVYDCQRLDKYGSIILTEKQHQPMHEGIVVATWEPWVEQVIQKRGDNAIPMQLQHESELAPGDRVMYPHYAGIPLDFTAVKISRQDTGFRLVSELYRKHPTGVLEGQIVGTITDDNREAHVIEKLKALIDKWENSFPLSIESSCKEDRHLLATLIVQDFLVVDRLTPSVTMLGK